MCHIHARTSAVFSSNNAPVDNIESNISSIAVDTSGAAEELSTASEYQRKAGRRAACLMIVIVIVVCIVLLAVSFIVINPVSHLTCMAGSFMICTSDYPVRIYSRTS